MGNIENINASQCFPNKQHKVKITVFDAGPLENR